MQDETISTVGEDRCCRGLIKSEVFLIYVHNVSELDNLIFLIPVAWLHLSSTCISSLFNFE